MASFNIFRKDEKILSIQEPVPLQAETKQAQEDDNDRFSFASTGRHDNGKLPPLKPGNEKLQELARFVQAVKQESNNALSKEIQKD
mmetsp:Transcript_10256/g.11790  ORF Transcript_10256/g.11790 Transcript_10256/m.11790 type:complete len:86 (+) Transcript_10256:119-376(+)|eukprot:CAMPEP_0184012536 /NCGR_PEP_ID=MMETSP0954-20121128/4476_1 /TAXON_ID=627963 /ORGANISM="Aplanochytrium sp, Strain PBS07" /LENGTH=85 /DNA_ID=CAMNT_0026292553 /DNA_START=92 /DNA_END=349 /DNA_ORIENTATION=+